MAKESARILTNITQNELKIVGADGAELVLAPLEKRGPLNEEELRPFDLKLLQQRGLAWVEEVAPATQFDWIPGILPLVGVGYFMAGAALTDKWPQLNPWYWPAAALLIAMVLIMIVWSSVKGPEVVRRTCAQFVSLCGILGVGIGLPLLTATLIDERLPQLSKGSVGRLIQLLFVTSASMLPALLYYLFDRQQLGTLRRRVEQQVLRFDPTVSTLQHVRAKYGSQLDEAYGRDVAGPVRLSRGTRWPIFIATLVVTLGWIVTLVSATPREGPNAVIEFLSPQPSELTFGFLGTYFFTLHLILRRYVRGDLKPKAYSAVAVRVLVVATLAWVLRLLLPDSKVGLAFMFLVGIIPETGVTFILESVRKLAGMLGTIEEKHPLTRLEGIDLYDRSRLLDEGVTNIESLAHHDLIDLMLETRIPVPRIIDWVDQAVLYLHLGIAEEAGRWETDRVVLQRLRLFGIRNATDLERVYGEAQSRGRYDLEAMLDGLDAPVLSTSASGKTLPRLRIILDALADDEWLDCIRNWRIYPTKPPRIEVPAAK